MNDQTTRIREADLTIESLEGLLGGRYSCRAFRGELVPQDTIERILTAAQRTPSWSNVQPWRVDVVRGAALMGLKQALTDSAGERQPDFPFPESFNDLYKQRRRESGWKLYEAVGVERGNREQSAAQARRNFVFFDAPHVAIVTTDQGLGTYGAIDCGLYIQSFLLAAQALGVAAVPQAALAAKAPTLRRELTLPDDRLVVAAISFGLADDAHPSNGFRTDRAGLDEAVHFHD